MTLPDGYALMPVTSENLEEVLRLDFWTFPTSLTVEAVAKLPSPLSWDRTWVVRNPRGAAVGLHGTYPLRRYQVPGAEVACGFLTWVGVHPGHRRRGILREMIDFHLADCAANGEAISALTASEPAIYGRFGYGNAGHVVGLSIPRGAPLRPVAGSEALDVELAEWDAQAHGQVVADLHAAYGRGPFGINRPGWATWETPGLRASRDDDSEGMRDGKESRRVLVVRDGDTPLGYATFRREVPWSRTGPNGTVHVRDAVALTPAAAHRLWSVLLDLDLTERVRIGNVVIDEPIMQLLVDSRKASPDLGDHTWVRIVDLPAAIGQRVFPSVLDVVVEVTDAMRPDNAGRWHLRAEAGGHGRAERTDAPAQLGLDIRELGAAYLGTITLAAQAAAGLVTVSDAAALAPTSAAFSWPVAAGTNWVF